MSSQCAVNNSFFCWKIFDATDGNWLKSGNLVQVKQNISLGWEYLIYRYGKDECMPMCDDVNGDVKMIPAKRGKPNLSYNIQNGTQFKGRKTAYWLNYGWWRHGFVEMAHGPLIECELIAVDSWPTATKRKKIQIYRPLTLVLSITHWCLGYPAFDTLTHTVHFIFLYFGFAWHTLVRTFVSFISLCCDCLPITFHYRYGQIKKLLD